MWVQTAKFGHVCTRNLFVNRSEQVPEILNPDLGMINMGKNICHTFPMYFNVPSLDGQTELADTDTHLSSNPAQHRATSLMSIVLLILARQADAII